jgi:rsbT co-antagonist protein RsbR
MRITQRKVTLALLGLMSVGSVAILIILLSTSSQMLTIVSSIIATLVSGGLLYFYWRGWEPVRYLTVAFYTLLVGLAMPEYFLTEEAALSILIAPVLALILLNPASVIGSAIVTYTLLLLRAGWQGPYARADTFSVYIIVIGGMILARLVTDAAQHAAESNAQQAQQALTKSEEQSAELAQQTNELRQQNEQQRRLIDLVATLETPAVALADGVLLAPIVGHLDSRRAQNLTARILQMVSEQRTRMVILDISGVSTVDTQVAHALLKAIQAIRLLGCEVTITGISASVATTITHLGISLAGVSTSRTPQDALTSLITLNTIAKTAARVN